MNIDFIGDGEYFETVLYQTHLDMPGYNFILKTKPTEKLLELLKYLEDAKTRHDHLINHIQSFSENFENNTIFKEKNEQ